uniref:Groucho/TLE N-terminal Q-rich domain-containing protein n=1 Tax=Capra hircus TaxID=9925 RepID=A0A8C2NV55_CAPHI
MYPIFQMKRLRLCERNHLERGEFPEGRDGKSRRGRALTVQMGVGLLGSVPQIPTRRGESSVTSSSPPPTFQHQQQVLGAIERAKQVTAPELNSIIRQQLQAHQLSQLQALALPLTPLPVGLQPPSLPAVSAGTGLLSLSALGSQAHLSKEGSARETQ